MQPVGVFVGAATLDLHYLVPEGRTRDSKGPALEFGMYAGGPATNAAVTFAHLGGFAYLFTEIGMHPLGSLIADDLAAHRVGLVDLIADVAGFPMVSSVISVEGSGERMAVSSHYADAGSAESLTAPLPETAAVLLLDGFLRAPGFDAATRAAERGIPVLLDGGSWKPGMEDLLPLVDVAVCSADFAPPGASTHDDVLDYLQDRGIEQVAITRGAEPILYRDRTDGGQILIDAENVVDTLGAGDIFHGALCWFLAAGRSFTESLADASAVATRSCRSFGTRAWMYS